MLRITEQSFLIFPGLMENICPQIKQTNKQTKKTLEVLRWVFKNTSGI